MMRGMREWLADPDADLFARERLKRGSLPAASPSVRPG